MPATIRTIPAIIGPFKNTAFESSSTKVTPHTSIHRIAVTAPEPLQIGEDMESSMYLKPI